MTKRFFATVLFIVFSGLSTVVVAQTTDVVPISKPALAAFLAGAALDNVTTNIDLRTSNITTMTTGVGDYRITTTYLVRGTEANPLLFWAHDNPTEIAIASVLTDALTVYVAHKLNAKHHKLVTVGLYSLAAARFSFGVHNALLYRSLTAPSPMPVYGVFSYKK